jgi:hypothetical protein
VDACDQFVLVKGRAAIHRQAPWASPEPWRSAPAVINGILHAIGKRLLKLPADQTALSV